MPDRIEINGVWVEIPKELEGQSEKVAAFLTAQLKSKTPPSPPPSGEE